MSSFHNVAMRAAHVGAVDGASHRRGTALILVLLMTVTLAAIAMSAILLTGTGGMIGRYYDREREFRYAAEAALQMGKARCFATPRSTFPTRGYVTLHLGRHDHGRRRHHDSQGEGESLRREVGQHHGPVRPVREHRRRGVRCRRHALRAPAGNAGRELRALRNVHEHVPGRFCYSTGEFIPGRAHSNQGWNTCGSPTYYDTVSARRRSRGRRIADVQEGLHQRRRHRSRFRHVSQLAILHTHALEGNLDVIRGRQRSVESCARASSSLRSIWTTTTTSPTTKKASSACIRRRARHRVPGACAAISVRHRARRRRKIALRRLPHRFDRSRDVLSGLGPQSGVVCVGQVVPAAHGRRSNDEFPVGTTITPADRDKIMSNPSFRCYMSGDPHLVAIERRQQLPARCAYPVRIGRRAARTPR